MADMRDAPEQPAEDATLDNGDAAEQVPAPVAFAREHPWRAGLAAVLFLWLVLSWFAGGGGPRDHADALPKDTVGYVAAVNLGRVRDALKDSGLLEEMTADLSEEDAELARSLLADARALRVSFHEPSGGVREDKPVAVLAAVEMSGTVDPAERFPAEWMEGFETREDDDGNTIYSHGAGTDEEVHLCGRGGRLYAATDAALLARQLEGTLTDDGSLSETGDFRDAVDGLPDGDVLAYVSGPALMGLLRKAALSAGRGDREAMMAAESLGIEDFRGGVLVGGYDGAVRMARLLVDDVNPVYAALEQPRRSFDIARYLPETAPFFVCAAVGDPAETLERVLAVVMRAGIAMGALDDEAEFAEGRRYVEERFDIPLAEVAELVDGEVGVFAVNAERNGPVFYAAVEDPEETHVVFLDWLEEDWRDPPRERTVGEFTIYTVGAQWETLSWVFIDDFFFTAEHAESLEPVCKAMDEGATLRGFDRYKELSGRLPARSTARIYVNVGPQVQPLLRSMAPDGEEPPEIPVLGLSVTVEDGRVDVRLATDRELDLEEALRRLAEPMRAARRQRL